MISGVLRPAAAISRRQFASSRSRSNIGGGSITVQHLMHGHPFSALGGQRLFTILPEGIVFSLPTILDFHPARLDPAVALHAVQDGIEHSVRPLNLLPRTG